MKRRIIAWTAWAILIVALAAGCRNTFVNAIIADDRQAVAGFLNEGANVNEMGADGFTPLHWAAYHGKADMIRFLVSRGAEVNRVSPQYGPPIAVAAAYGFTDAVRALLEAGADPSLKDASGQTALSYAEQGGFQEIVALLGGSRPAPARKAVRPEPVPAAPPAAVPAPAVTAEPPPTADTPAGTAAPVRIAVYNFHAGTIDAATASASVTASLVRALRAVPSFQMVERRELEEFLTLNDLRQSDSLDEIFQVGERMGIPYIVAGSVQKSGTVYIVQCRLVNVQERIVILDRQVRSFGEAGLDREVEKLGQAVTKAIRGGR